MRIPSWSSAARGVLGLIVLPLAGRCVLERFAGVFGIDDYPKIDEHIEIDNYPEIDEHPELEVFEHEHRSGTDHDHPQTDHRCRWRRP